jgi:hypothetical protein
MTTKSTLPKFKSREEEAAWFEAHMTEHWDEVKPVEVNFAKNLSTGLNVRFDPDSLEKLRAIARDKGIGPTTLVHMWVMEHLKAAH